MVIGAQLSDLITIESANIWGKLFLSLRLFILCIKVRASPRYVAGCTVAVGRTAISR